VANKKCPKCGEDNPAEAVMCWACYTPLTAGAGAAMGAGARSGATTFPASGAMPHAGGAQGGEQEKKKTDPRLFFVGGGLLVAGLIFAFTSGLIGGGGGAPPSEAGPVATDPPGTGQGPVTVIVPQSPVPIQPVVGGPTQPQQPTGPTIAPVPARYRVVVPPSPKYPTATLAIAPTTPGAPAGPGLAKSARQQYQKSGKWSGYQIAVFSQAEDATAFRDYMNTRRGAPLGPQQYAELTSSNAFKGASTFYTFRDNRENYYSPSTSPNWWNNSTG